jgi:hypothetical protein
MVALHRCDQGRCPLWHLESVREFDSRAYGGTPHCCFEHAEQTLYVSMPPRTGAEEPDHEANLSALLRD